MDPPHIFLRPSGLSHHPQAPQDPFQSSSPQDPWGPQTPPCPPGLTGTLRAPQLPLSGSPRSPGSLKPPTPSLSQSSPIPGPLSIEGGPLKTTFRPLRVLLYPPGSLGPHPLQAPFCPRSFQDNLKSTHGPFSAPLPPRPLSIPSREPLRFPSDLEAPQRPLRPLELHVDA